MTCLQALLAATEVVAGARDAVSPVVQAVFGLRRDAHRTTAFDEAIGAEPLAAVRSEQDGFGVTEFGAGERNGGHVCFPEPGDERRRARYFTYYCIVSA